MTPLHLLKIKIFADIADKTSLFEWDRHSLIQGFTTNPTLMRKAGITHYKSFALDILRVIKDKPISFEVFSDNFTEMHKQALEIASWGSNVYVKIPVTNTQGKPTYDLIHLLARNNIKQNVTAVMTFDQLLNVKNALMTGPSSYISIFAGRIADTGRDPEDLISAAVKLLQPYPQLELIWASSRELFNIYQANNIGCPIITLTQAILKKIHLVGKDLLEYSLETVKMFYDDSVKAGFNLETIP